jgi:hypothetical protein
MAAILVALHRLLGGVAGLVCLILSIESFLPDSS